MTCARETRSPTGRDQANVGDGLGVRPERGAVARRDVVARVALEHLRDGVAADRAFDRVLDVGDVDAEACRGFAVDGEVQVGLTEDAEQAEIGDALDVRHNPNDLVALGLKRLEIVP